MYVDVLHTSYHSPWRDCHGNCKGNDTIKAYIPTFTCNFVTKNIIIYRHIYRCLVGLSIQYSSIILYNSKWIYPCLLDSLFQVFIGQYLEFVLNDSLIYGPNTTDGQHPLLDFSFIIPIASILLLVILITICLLCLGVVCMKKRKRIQHLEQQRYKYITIVLTSLLRE